MSYEIEYKRCCIKSPRGYTIMWLHGSSNCTERHWDARGKLIERLERYWSIWCGQMSVPENELIEYAKTFNSPYNENWKRAGKWIDNKGVQTWVNSAIKRAVSIEDILQANHVKCFNAYVAYYANRSVDCRREQKLVERISTGQELDNWAIRAKLFIAETKRQGGEGYLHMNFLNVDECIIPPPEEGAREVLMKIGKSYVAEVNGCSYKTTNTIQDAKVFNRKDALNIIATSPFGCDLCRAKLIDSRRKEADSFVVKFEDGAYVARTTRNGIYVTYNANKAKRFLSKSEANAFCNRMQKRTNRTLIPQPA